MPVREVTTRPVPLVHFPDHGGYRWLELHDRKQVYGHAAIATRDHYLELHLTLARWGPFVRRSLKSDLVWLKGEARRLGLSKIMGIRADDHGGFDDRLFRFAKLYGFSEVHVFQTASLTVE